MPSMRTIARAGAWLLPLAAAACLTDPAAPIDTSAPTALRVVAQTSPSDGDRTVRVEVSFVSMAEEDVQLPVSPAELTVPANSSVTERVTTRLERCFAEGYTGEGGLYCPLRVHLVLLDDAGEQLAEGFASVNVLPGQNPVTVPSISLVPATTGIAGVVKDATTGDGVAAANVALYAGTNTEASPVATLVAGSGGAYLFPNLAPGTYTIVAGVSGYTSTTSEPITVVAGQVTTYDIVVSPQLEEGQLRIVLTWGATPEDLDSYLFGPPSAGSYHVFYASDAAPPWANLDVDETNGFGPETITITQQAEGTHIYAVHNYSDALTTPDDPDLVARSALANSGARVVVYDASGPIAEFTVPNEEGTLWTVFTLNAGVITPVNLMSFVADPDVTPPEGIATSVRRDGPSLARKAAAKRAAAPRQ